MIKTKLLQGVSQMQLQKQLDECCLKLNVKDFKISTTQSMHKHENITKTTTTILVIYED